MSRASFASLRFRLLALVLLATIPALGLMLYSASLQRRLSVTTARGDWLRLARLAASNQEHFIEGARQLVTTMAHLPEVRGRDAAACSALAADLLKRYPLYENLGAAGPDGTVFCSAVPSPQAPAGTETAWLERAARTRDFTVGDYRVDRATGRAGLLCAHPAVAPAGGVQAVAFAVLNLTWLNQFAAEAQLPPGSALIVVDHEGTILARHPDPQKWVGKSVPGEPLPRAMRAQGEGLAQVSGVDGIPRLFAFTALRGIPKAIHVGIGVPTGAPVGAANQTFVLGLAGVALAALLALAAAWIAGDLLILRRVHAVLGAAERLSGGDLTARAPAGGGDEIGAVARAFNDMAQRLAAMVDSEQRARAALAEQVKQLVTERTREVELLNQMGEMLQACQSTEEAYSVIGELAAQFFAGDAGVVFNLNPARKLLEVGAVWGMTRAGEREVFTPEECWGLRRGRAHLVEDTSTGLLCRHLPMPLPAAYLCVPLVAHGEALGVLHIAGPPGQSNVGEGLSEAKQRLAVTVAEQLALSMANIRLRETLRSQSIRDPLTGLFNRRYMEEILEREVRWSKRKGRLVGVIMLDIDRFKEVNDTFGHEAGDAVLRELGALLKAKVRAVDVGCRYGGEEFVLILPEASLENTRRRAEQIREAVKRLRVAHEGQAIPPITISLGAASAPEHGGSAEAVLRAADAALYAAKVAGRDQVAIAE